MAASKAVVLLLALNDTVTPRLGKLADVSSPSLVDGVISFSGMDITGSRSGIFTAAVGGPVACAAADGDAMPGGGGTIGLLGEPSGGATLYFSATGTGGGTAVLRWNGSSLDAAVRSAKGGLGAISRPAASSGGVAFFAVNGSDHSAGIFRIDGTGAPAAVVDNRTTIPAPPSRGAGAFRAFDPFALHGGAVAFFGSNLVPIYNATSTEGVYVSSPGGSVAVVAESGATPVPGLTDATFFGFGGVRLDDGVVSFFAEGGNGVGTAIVGVYARSPDGDLRKVADTRDWIPACGDDGEVRGTFQYVQQQTCDSSGCVFLGNDRVGDRGLYYAPAKGGKLRCIVDQTTTYAGSPFSYLEMQQPAMDDAGTLAFYGYTANGTNGIFTTPLR